MKTTLTFALSMLVLICTSVMLSCEHEEARAMKGHVFFAIAKKTFDLNDQAQANQLIRALAEETAEINILEDAAIIGLTDTRGDYKAISVTYQARGKITKMIVPVSEVSSVKPGMMAGAKAKGNIWYSVSADACKMKCTTVSECTGSTHEVVERCGQQKCSCSSGGEASASVTFND